MLRKIIDSSRLKFFTKVILKEDIFQLIDKVSDKDKDKDKDTDTDTDTDTELVYYLIKTIIENNPAVEADNSPLTDCGKVLIMDENEGFLNWIDIYE